jgi:large subunit ribosomal protein L7/L12
MANATLGKDEILEAIGNMKVSELVELTEAFKTKFNVTIAVAAAGPAAGAAAAPAVEEQTEFSVVLASAGAKDLVDGAPKEVKAGVSKDEAAQVKSKLEAAGATVELK